MEDCGRNPDVSVVVVVYNMARAAPRTLQSLSAAYQRHIDPDDYEVIVVDNGSNPPLDPIVVDGLPGNFRFIRIDDASPSPALAVNRGIAEARGEVIGVMIDGARIVTPGLLHFARHGARLYPRAVVASLGWHLGLDLQRWAIAAGYDQAREDALLASIDWPSDGYRLFEIGAFDGSSIDGWFLPFAESNALFLTRDTWDALGGMDARFDSAGGGFVNLDTFRRAIELPGSELVILLGEATFHQLHGGVASNQAYEQFSRAAANWVAQYEKIRGGAWATPLPQNRTYIGVLPRPALAPFVRAALEPSRVRLGQGEPPLGHSFDRALWSLTPPVRPADPTIVALVDLAQSEFRCGRLEASAAVARLARGHAPDEHEPQRILALAAASLPAGTPAGDRRAEFHLALGEAYRVLGDGDRSAAEYRAALALDDNLPRAHMGLALLRMPGPDCLAWLARLHAELAPETYIQIGVADGRPLALARPPTRAIGVDPAPMVDVSFKTETHVYAETSEEFFAKCRPAKLLEGRPLGLGSIGGPHLFEQALKDFVHLEALCGPRSVILLHGTVPLDEATQRRVRRTAFHTGDVWKTVLCLEHYRPDLDIFTIATPSAGLTVVTGLDPSSSILADQYEVALARFMDTPFKEIEGSLPEALGIVANDWPTVEARLKARGVL